MATTDGLQQPFKANVEALIAASGGRVTIRSGFRTRAEQIQLRRDNCGSSNYAIFEMPAGQCSPVTAKPGESDHERGLAVDFAGDLDWVSANAARYGMHRTVPSEYWHYEPIGGAAGQRPTAPIGPSGPIGPGAPGADGGDGGGVDGGFLGVGYIVAFVQRLLSASFWLRVLELAAGVALVVAGIAIAKRDTLAGLAKAVA